jgi:hypothetical protein
MNEEATYLQLTPNFRVFRCDDRNFELEELREVISRPNRYVKEETRSNKWVSHGYYSNLSHVVNGVLKLSVGNLSVKQKMDLENIVVELKKISSELMESVKESGITLEHFVKSPDNRGRKPSSTIVTSQQSETKKGNQSRLKKTTTKK